MKRDLRIASMVTVNNKKVTGFKPGDLQEKKMNYWNMLMMMFVLLVGCAEPVLEVEQVQDGEVILVDPIMDIMVGSDCEFLAPGLLVDSWNRSQEGNTWSITYVRDKPTITVNQVDQNLTFRRPAGTWDYDQENGDLSLYWDAKHQYEITVKLVEYVEDFYVFRGTVMGITGTVEVQCW